ncbi:NADP-dependent oxidoreductase [Streptomyces roseirectus]|uniref:NADP-dependent oxidoreductase n=1 Tax=Streptomyces roseirectus TaxID=2768066 RepID=A0A7H0IGJ1_9ACTN|nr:NADP-dependent oxidoreductase [Streptomyces roseirectus]QNP71907.1 NADP-dependent oxidoreductase [Streptomyces roseirectus]
MSVLSREIRLAATPRGLPAPTDFTVTETRLPDPVDGQLLLRNHQFLLFAGLRTLLGGAARNTPVPALAPGDTLYGPALAEVIHAPDDSPLRPGDLVTHFLGWREYALAPASQCTPVAPELPDPLAQLSSGGAAFGALTRLTGVREDDIVLVTGAAGGVGSLAGQIARLLGAKRVIGTTSSPRKAGRLVTELGYDDVLTGTDDWGARLADGIDVLVDTVGGAQLAAAVDVARRGARFALVGALSGQLAAEGTGATAPVAFDAYQLVLKGVSLRGYLGVDHPGVEAEWIARFAHWLRAGEIRFPVTRTTGIERAPQALRDLFEGKQFGTAVVELAE